MATPEQTQRKFAAPVNVADGVVTPASRALALGGGNDTVTVNTPQGYVDALYVGGAGSIMVDTIGGDTSIVFNGLLGGSILPVQVTRVYATNTTATNIVGLWHG